MAGVQTINFSGPMTISTNSVTYGVLASSSFALAGTLERLAELVKARQTGGGT
jgi:hypothetical protein